MKKSAVFNLPPYGIAQKNERSMRVKKSAVFNLPPYGIAQKSEGNIRMKKSTVFNLPHMELLKKNERSMRMKKSAAFRLFHEHSDNCGALSELRSSEFARAIVNMRRSEKRNATFFSPYFFRFFEHSPYVGSEKEMQRFSAHTSFAF